MHITFKKFSSVSNPVSMHGIYPYRGKISALDAESIIAQLEAGKSLLDPFCGSGTIIYEAQKRGLHAFGVDANPLAIEIAKAKVYKNTEHSIALCAELINNAQEDIRKGMVSNMPSSPLNSFHPKTAMEIMAIKKYFDEMDDYIRGVFYGSIALAARGCNGYIWTSTTVGKNIEDKTYINFFDKMLKKAKKHASYFVQKDSYASNLFLYDSRKLTDVIQPKSIDYVFTSPPYFDALDYTAYYAKLIYEIFGNDRNEIKKQLIQTVDTYQQDMAQVLHELEIVTKDNAIMIFVVGDKKVGKEVINGGLFFNNIKKATYIEERSYSGSASKVFDKLNNTQRKEQIIVWQKQNGRYIFNE